MFSRSHKSYGLVVALLLTVTAFPSVSLGDPVIYDIEAPNGQIFNIEAPEDATDEQLFGFVQHLLNQAKRAEQGEKREEVFGAHVPDVSENTILAPDGSLASDYPWSRLSDGTWFRGPDWMTPPDADLLPPDGALMAPDGTFPGAD